MSQPSERLDLPRHVVTAVLVAHDGARWLPRALHAVKTQRRPVQRFVAVDTGSRDSTRRLLDDSVGSAAVIEASRDTGFGSAVALAVDAFGHAPALPSAPMSGPRVEWIWLLHDDCAPDPAALEAMLGLADQTPSAGVIGPKVRGWHDRRVLLELGVTVDRGGGRQAGMERGELDQGQHDQVRDVLSVSSAGMLVRRDVWEAVGGFDAALPLFRDDLDFCWRARQAGHRVLVCPDAVVHHAEASASGQRRPAVGSRRPRRLDRRAALRTLLVNCAPAVWPLMFLRLLVGVLVRSVAFVVAKRPSDAWDEIVAAASVFGRPAALWRARRVRARLRRQSAVSARDAHRLLAPPGTRLRRDADALGRALSARFGLGHDETANRYGAIETGPAEDDGAPVTSGGLVVRILRRPGVLFALVLLVVTLVAERHLLGGGALRGGALLPAPSGASDLWHLYVSSWHPTGLGSGADAPPYLALVAALATVLFGHAGLAVDVLLLGSVPLAGITAYVAAGHLVGTGRTRMWVAASYALLPVATGAVAGGRLGVAVGLVLLPTVLTKLARVVAPAFVALTARGPGAHRARRQRDRRRREHPGSARAAWVATLLLAIATAFDPMIYLLLAPLVLVAVGVAVARRLWGVVAGGLLVLVGTVALLLPWSWDLVRHPGPLLLGIGGGTTGTFSSLSDARLPVLDLLLLRPGGPGMPPAWAYAAVAVAGLAALTRRTHRRLAVGGWALVIMGLGGGIAVSRVSADPALGGAAVHGWPGTATALMAIGLLIAAVAALSGLTKRLASVSFSWYQPAALLLTAAAAIAPLAAAGGWLVRGAGHPLERAPANVVPAYVGAQDAVAGPGSTARTLVLRPGDAGVRYAVVREHSPTLGYADLRPARDQVARMDAAVADFAAGGGASSTELLARYGVRYVLLPLTGGAAHGVPAGAAADLRARLSASGGLVLDSATSSFVLWHLATPTYPVALVDPVRENWTDMERLSGTDPQRGTWNVPYSPSPRLIVLAEAPSDRWTATLDGKPLEPSTYFGMQAFDVPVGAGTLAVHHDDAGRGGWLALELALLIVTVVFATPSGAGGRRPAGVGRPGEPDSADGSDRSAAGVPGVAGPVDGEPADGAAVPAGSRS